MEFLSSLHVFGYFCFLFLFYLLLVSEDTLDETNTCICVCYQPEQNIERDILCFAGKGEEKLSKHQIWNYLSTNINRV